MPPNTDTPDLRAEVAALRDTAGRLEERLAGVEALLRLQIDHQKERTANRNTRCEDHMAMIRALQDRTQTIEQGLTRRGM